MTDCNGNRASMATTHFQRGCPSIIKPACYWEGPCLSSGFPLVANKCI
jgi:hypothetical protein